MFSRPHIEFIQSQCLPWSPAPRGIPGAECKILSRADRGGACSLLLRYPPGWQRDLTEYSPADEEFYVLEGRIEIDSQIFGADSYAFRPAGFTRRSIQSPEGCVMLAFYSREPVWLSGPGNGAAERSPRSVGFLDTATMPWDMTLNDPRLAHLGISRKNLRTDPGTGERTFLSLVVPQSAPPGGAGPQEMHPVVEEAYVIAGALCGPHGTMNPGAYFWRPPGIAHGPFGSRIGSMSLIRFVGGRHVNEWTTTETPFDFAASYDPVLPPNLANLAHECCAPVTAW
mgnify:FL=1